MIQVHTCVRVCCDQCGDALGSPECDRHYSTENAAMDAATADGWRIDHDDQWWCSACAPALICQIEGHQYSPWRHPHTRNGHPAPSTYRYCRRCCVLESRLATRGGSEPAEGIEIGKSHGHSVICVEDITQALTQRHDNGDPDSDDDAGN